ncbi:hypothetical protein [Actibacterium pelagium]|uniref:Uncharacterized protein n=1 Tax=Actibacterium pelagium TaxID=2029103 RepID=A0A917AH09_9RHOB|nr:hypothetical protein [Actibacterium pelagium]GGE49953.1 hypothetical protein GCM10011517_17160 [Actibacterium pelagium]
MVRLPALLILLIAATPVQAGAWLRDKGDTLIILQHEDYSVDRYDDRFSKLYLEHGLSKSFTLVGEVSRSQNFDKNRALLSLRTPLFKTSGDDKFSLEFGVGIAQDGNLTQQLMRSTVAWGKGLQTRFGHGWTNIEVSVEQQALQTRGTADLTLGLDLRPDTKLILQLQNGTTEDNTFYSRFTPSLTYEIRPDIYLELGLRKGLSGENSQGLKLGTWLQF